MGAHFSFKCLCVLALSKFISRHTLLLLAPSLSNVFLYFWKERTKNHTTTLVVTYTHTHTHTHTHTQAHAHSYTPTTWTSKESTLKTLCQVVLHAIPMHNWQFEFKFQLSLVNLVQIKIKSRDTAFHSYNSSYLVRSTKKTFTSFSYTLTSD